VDELSSFNGADVDEKALREVHCGWTRFGGNFGMEVLDILGAPCAAVALSST
jgi:hypothetical protein